MIDSTQERLSWLGQRIGRMQPVERSGRVTEVRGLIIESEGPDACVSDVCHLQPQHRGGAVAAEVVGFKGPHLLLMPYQETHDIHVGCPVVAGQPNRGVPAGQGLLGRVIDGMGEAIDGRGALHLSDRVPLHRAPPNPMQRRTIQAPLSTGVRALDLFTPLGEGQRLGIFAGSGVGKSTLMGMIARNADADVNVIALVGERGRELREFVMNDLGEAGLAKSVVVISTSDQAAPLRLRAAFLATALAEYFRDQGKKVMFLMDSLTRLAMAQREIGLSVGEPPTARGYTPSVFALLPRLLERTGMAATGSITALYTVLVEGDDLNEPVSDTVRGILDGHLVLSRALATGNHYPAIDVLESLSRLARTICTQPQLEAQSEARDLLSLYRKNEDLINVGAYVKGSNSRLDRAIQRREALLKVLQQRSSEAVSAEQSWSQLQQALKG